MLVLFHLCIVSKQTEGLAIVQYFKAAPPREAIESPNCLYLKLVTDDGLDYFVTSSLLRVK